MLALIRKMVRFSSSSKGAKITLVLWLLAVIGLSIFAPGSNDYKETSTEGSIGGDRPSEIADHIKQESFPSDDGLTTLIVFHHADGLDQSDREKIEQFSEWIASDEHPENIASALPFHSFPENVQDQTMSENGTTLLFNVTLKEGLENKDIQETLNAIEKKWTSSFDEKETMQFEMTGPAAISADTTRLFQDADFVLMIATISLIFVLLMIIYRSPLLAFIPLIIAGIVYGVVDRVLGLFGIFDLFTIESQAVSIMLVLLFAVVTDYSLFIFSRYREELHNYESKYGAMNKAIYHVSEPIFFSGGTIILAMLTLFVTVFTPYHSFAPVFSVAIVFILMAGLTLIPALFALLGRKAFWPSIPKLGDTKKEKHRFWGWVGRIVTKFPIRIGSIIALFLVIGIINLFPIQFSFNLLKSFPEDMSSRVGFELLEDNYSPGDLAPVTVLLNADKHFENEDLKDIQKLQTLLEENKEINTVQSKLTDDMTNGREDLPRNFMAENKRVIQFDLVLNENPYDREALDVVQHFQDHEQKLLNKSGLSDQTALYFSGQTAEQLDVYQMNKRDLALLFPIVIVLLSIVLGFQTRSIGLPILMMGTIVVSYLATLGFGWLIFHTLMGYDAISYRLPLYTFVFMVALGIDYNIMLVSRIKEFAKHTNWKDAIRQGVSFTGGVISSAGVILAATFSVLMTQPIQELFLFGFIMAVGILLDTFIIRGFFLPAILSITHRNK